MIFLTYWFIAAAAVFFPLYWFVPGAVIRPWLLLAFCMVFHYHFAGPAGVLPILFLGAVTYAAGISRHRVMCILGIVLCVLALVFYKYTQFVTVEVVGMMYKPLGTYLLERARPRLPAAPPLAISFFVFEFVHYLYDIWHGSRPIRNPLHFSIFSIFWPSIVAGPVKRYETFIPALEKGLNRTTELEAAIGLMRLAVGICKKFIADMLTAWVTHFQDRFETLPLQYRWVLFCAIGLRILLDFSGYSDMAIGFARMMGIRLPENFNWPYLATSLTDFWRRWHISLSTWIRDYVYIPLGGSRHGLVRKCFNGLFAFALCGLWHGAQWNFVLWGLYHGAGLAASSTAGSALRRAGAEKALHALKPVTWILTALFVSFGWLLFFYPPTKAFSMAKALFGVAAS